MNNSPSEELRGTEAWIVKLSYRHKRCCWKGQKVEWQPGSESVWCISEVGEQRAKQGGEKKQKKKSLVKVWHSTFYQAPGLIIQILPAYGFIWIRLSVTPPSFLRRLSFLPSSILAFASPPLFWLPPSLIPSPLPPIIYLPYLPLSIAPSLWLPAFQSARRS